MRKREAILEGIRSKIQRADDNISYLDSRIKALVNEEVYRLVSRPSEDDTQSIVYIVGPPALPLYLSVVVGEIVHQLRSSLDHLISALVIQNGNLPKKSNQYPICDTPDLYEKACKAGYLKGISAEAEHIIASRQPYMSAQGDLSKNFLYVLKEMDNTDKHRMLNVVVGYGLSRELAIGSEKQTGEKRNIVITGISPILPQEPTEHGTEVMRFTFEEPTPNVKISGKPIMRILFDESGVLPKVYVMHAIKQLRNKLVQLLIALDPNLGDFPLITIEHPDPPFDPSAFTRQTS